MRIPVKIAAGRFLLLDAAEIYFIESDGDDVWVRTARKRRYRGGRRLAEWETRLRAALELPGHLASAADDVSDEETSSDD